MQSWHFDSLCCCCAVLGFAGYDSHFMDPLAGLQLESRTYHMLCGGLVSLAQELCDGRCMFILEGGYHQQSLAEAVVDSFAGILGLPVLSSGSNTVLPEEPLAKVRQYLLSCVFCREIPASHLVACVLHNTCCGMCSFRVTAGLTGRCNKPQQNSTTDLSLACRWRIY
jgi:hypothetical protein